MKATQKAREEALMHQSRFAQMGEMMSLIAHQWRQPLGEISGMFMELEAASRFNKLDRALMATISARATGLLDYMSQTIDDFRYFFKPSKTKEAFDVKSVCEETLRLAKASLRSQGIKGRLEAEETCEVVGYSRELSQVLLTLILNAKDELAKRAVTCPWITLHVKVMASAVRIGVEDNAGGVEEAIKPRLFEPYASTKAEHGTGLGLYMAKMIVHKSMHGRIWLEEGENGAHFMVEVPR
ncbi:MAG: HAMP domain-containing histidine kinase [Marichromatium sp.]|nr:HAMP domain-containing histidine kinase [Marichromatium sp.]